MVGRENRRVERYRIPENELLRTIAASDSDWTHCSDGRTKVPPKPRVHLYADDMVRDEWTFLSNHGHALVCVAADPDVRLRDVALQVGVTERSAQQIVSDLEAGGVVQRRRTGRRNTYVVCRNAHFRHPLESGLTVGEFLDLVGQARSGSARISTFPSAPSAASRSDDEGPRYGSAAGVA